MSFDQIQSSVGKQRLIGIGIEKIWINVYNAFGIKDGFVVFNILGSFRPWDQYVLSTINQNNFTNYPTHFKILWVYQYIGWFKNNYIWRKGR